MIDPNFLKKKINFVAKKLSYRNFKLDISEIKKNETDIKSLYIQTEKLRIKRNKYAKIISNFKKYGKDISNLKKLAKKINSLLNIKKSELNNLQKNIYNFLMSLPNITADEVPIGYNAEQNLEIDTWGHPKSYNFPIKNHVEIGKEIGGIDFSSATKIAGSKFVVMYGNIAYLHRSLIRFMLDLHVNKHGYTEYYLPYFTNYISLKGAGRFSESSKDLFHIKNNKKNILKKSYALIPTAEIPLINLVRDKVLNEEILPIKMVAHTPCFRYEAGSYGKNAKGLIRMHQFDKVEMVQIVNPENSMQALEEITKHAETVLQLLNLPYRKVLLCTGELGFSSCKSYDLEVWLPGENSYREISSCSNTGDFQSRRIQSYFKKKLDKKKYLTHILNGSGLAIDRTLAAILENYQLENGTIAIPAVLQSYMNGLEYIS